jgi:sugar phosphate isomerase/epimerase
VRFCIELHDHSITPSASAALRILESLPEQGCAVILDAANTLLEGNEALPMVLDMLGTRLAHVHVKQRSFRRRTSPHRATMVDFPISPLHEPGDIVWTDIAALLRARDYAGWWSAEDFTASVDWRLKLQTQASWMRATLLGDSTLG